jgi:hypothetical protein
VAIGLAEEALCKIDPDTAAPDGAEKRYQIGPHYMLLGDNEAALTAIDYEPDGEPNWEPNWEPDGGSE